MKNILLLLIFLALTSSGFGAEAPVSDLSRLHQTIVAAGVPIHGVGNLVCGSPTTARVDFNNATAPQQATAASIVASFDCSPAAQAGYENTQARTKASSDVDDSRTPEDKKLRAVLLVAIDELNNLRQWITSFKACTAAATNLATLQSCVAGLPNMPDRTPAQAKTAVKNKIDSGSVD